MYNWSLVFVLSALVVPVPVPIQQEYFTKVIVDNSSGD